MSEIRLANMFYEQRGPLVFSASVHLAIVVVAAIVALIGPKKEPEELVFILSAPPPAGGTQAKELPVLDYEPEDVPMPTIEDIKLPERPKPEPVTREPEPQVIETPKQIETGPPKPKTMTPEEFERMYGKITRTNVPKETQTQQPRNPNIDINQFSKNLDTIDLGTSTSNLSQASKDEVASYIASFRMAVSRAVESHPFSGRALRVRVSCDIAANGKVSNVRILEGSGDSRFDQKVLSAFRSIQFFDAPPDNRPFSGIKFTLIQDG